MKNIKDQIVDAARRIKDVPPFFLIDTEVLDDGAVWFSYAFSEECAAAQKANTENGLAEGVYDEIVEPSIETYEDAASYIALRWRELEAAQEAGKGEADEKQRQGSSGVPRRDTRLG